MGYTGPLMVGIDGYSLTSEEKEILQHPLISGVILFTRNFASPEQLIALTDSIHRLRDPRLLIAVDQEGGRVQRFRAPFTVLPALGVLHTCYDQNPALALDTAKAMAQLMAMELLACNVDLSFAPVLDIDNGQSKIIGNRAFHGDPSALTRLARAYISGMHEIGMKAVGKHFPGHGSVINDTHLEQAIDPRSLSQIEQTDLIPFQTMIAEQIEGLMIAHVIYPEVDSKPAGFSSRWIKEILRSRYAFNGVIFSDDLGMMAAKYFGSAIETVIAALDAGCDRLLLCNEKKMLIEVLDQLKTRPQVKSNDALYPPKQAVSWSELSHNALWQKLHHQVLSLNNTMDPGSGSGMTNF